MTWSARKVNDKQHELIKENLKSRLICISETGRKGKDVIDLNEGGVELMNVFREVKL